MTSEDASFADGGEGPIRLAALDQPDLEVVSALIQDAVFTLGDIKFDRSARRLDLLINRFRWEDADRARAQARPFERVRALLSVQGVLGVASQGLDRDAKDLAVALLSLRFDAEDDGAGTVEFILSGGAVIAAKVEMLEVLLQDVNRPHAAPSRTAPRHD